MQQNDTSRTCDSPVQETNQQEIVQNQSINDNKHIPDCQTLEFNRTEDAIDVQSNKGQSKSDKKKDKLQQKQITIVYRECYNDLSQTDIFFYFKMFHIVQDRSNWIACEKCKSIQQGFQHQIYVICANKDQFDIIEYQHCYTRADIYVACLHQTVNPRFYPKQFGHHLQKELKLLEKKLEGDFFNKGSQFTYQIDEFQNACSNSASNRDLICNFLKKKLFKYMNFNPKTLANIAYYYEMLISKQPLKHNLLKAPNKESNNLEDLIWKKQQEIWQKQQGIWIEQQGIWIEQQGI